MKTMNKLIREKCILTNKDDLEKLYQFESFPVFMGCLNQPESQDIKRKMSWLISKGSGLIQLEQLIPLEVLYPESHGAGAVGGLWKKHHSEFARFISQIDPDGVFEIGGAHGILQTEYIKHRDVPWTIIEPNPSPIEGSKAKFIKGFFDEKFSEKINYDALVHSHVFEHIYNPVDFMKHLSKYMQEGKYLIFSIPNMQEMLVRNYTNCLNFEHTIFLTEPYIEYLLAKYGFRLVEKEYFLDDHSIFYLAIRDKKVKSKPLSNSLYEKNKKLYLDFIKYYENLILNLNQQIKILDNPIYLFGAHVFAQNLLEFGLSNEKIISILDNDTNKHGKRLYGTRFNVDSPSVLKNIENPVVILKAGVYTEEIKKDIIENINATTIFIPE